MSHIYTSNKKVVLITSGQPALNPRLVKEADSLCDAGFEVIVLYAYWNKWGDDFTNQLLLTKKWKAIMVGGHPIKNAAIYMLSRIIFAIAKLIVKAFGTIPFFASLAVARGSYFLIREAKKHKSDIYISHNLGALPACIKAAKKHHAKCGFDAEDFHRLEVSDDITAQTYQLAKYIEDKYLPHSNYITASSPQIADAYKQLYPSAEINTILNVFPKSKAVNAPITITKRPIKIVWFSQTIGTGRGLELLALALKKLDPTDFELHLLGYIDLGEKQKFIDTILFKAPNIYFHDPIAPDQLIDFASHFDIGVASEQHIPFNRDICLTNKIFTYLQAGLAVIASDTIAQKQFIDDNEAIGKVYHKNDVDTLLNILLYYHTNKDVLLETRKVSLKLGHEKYNWENESKVFLSIVNKTLNN